MIVDVWKNYGETPLECMNRLIKDLDIKNTKFAYTNRLDPMAQGTMTILFGDDIHLAPIFNKKNKVYSFKVAFGISTKSFDPLSLITKIEPVTQEQIILYNSQMLRLVGDHVQKIPMCSGAKHKGKPLWMYEKQGIEVNMTKNITIYDVSQKSHITTISDYGGYINGIIGKVSGDFNQDKIIEQWKDIKTIQYIEYAVKVSSGTFIRALGNDLGQKLGIPCHVFDITRQTVI